MPTVARAEELLTDPACERCGALAEGAPSLREGTHLCCGANCAAAGVQAEPLPEV